MWNWEAIAALAELGGTLGIVVTLVYLAFQIRQNSRLISTTIANADREASNDFSSLLAGNREAVRVFWAGLENRDDLELIDRQQFDAILMMNWNAIHLSTKSAGPIALDRYIWGLSKRGMRQWWNEYASVFPADFRLLVEERFRAVAS